MFGLLKGLKKTRDKVFSPIENLFKASKLSDEMLDEIEELLILGDLGVETSERVIESLRDAGKKRELSFEDCRRIVVTELEKIVEDVPDYKVPDVRPRVIIFVGVNGVGKTSTIGKLANRFIKDGMKVILGCADTFRAAAIEQLELWAKRVKAQVVKQKMGSDPAAVAYDAVQAAIARDVDVVMIDTAGRLHTKSNLMEELKKIVRVLSQKIQGVTPEVWLILDANTGQNSIRQAEEFTRALPVTGLVVTKLDSTAKAGVLIPIQSKLKVPVVFVGIGEGMDDIESFDSSEFIRALI